MEGTVCASSASRWPREAPAGWRSFQAELCLGLSCVYGRVHSPRDLLVHGSTVRGERPSGRGAASPTCLLHRDSVRRRLQARSCCCASGYAALGAGVLHGGGRLPASCCSHWALLLAGQGGGSLPRKRWFMFPFSSKLPLAHLLLPPDRRCCWGALTLTAPADAPSHPSLLLSLHWAVPPLWGCGGPHRRPPGPGAAGRGQADHFTSLCLHFPISKWGAVPPLGPVSPCVSARRTY